MEKTRDIKFMISDLEEFPVYYFDHSKGTSDVGVTQKTVAFKGRTNQSTI